MWVSTGRRKAGGTTWGFYLSSQLLLTPIMLAAMVKGFSTNSIFLPKEIYLSVRLLLRMKRNVLPQVLTLLILSWKTCYPIKGNNPILLFVSSGGEQMFHSNCFRQLWNINLPGRIACTALWHYCTCCVWLVVSCLRPFTYNTVDKFSLEQRELREGAEQSGIRTRD